tara:strand:- start:447 stop:629 length:183 start_codon:yes stop_codon:yes gene_type:complete
MKFLNTFLNIFKKKTQKKKIKKKKKSLTKKNRSIIKFSKKIETNIDAFLEQQKTPIKLKK